MFGMVSSGTKVFVPSSPPPPEWMSPENTTTPWIALSRINFTSSFCSERKDRHASFLGTVGFQLSGDTTNFHSAVDCFSACFNQVF